MSDLSKAALLVFSESLLPAEIASALNARLDHSARKGDPTGQEDPAANPFHVAIFRSTLSPENTLESHLAEMVTFIESRLDRISAIKPRCNNVAVQCSYKVVSSGGWSLSAELLHRMARTGLEFVFTIERN